MESAPADELFLSIVENIYLDKHGYRDLEPVDAIKDLLLDSLHHHLSRFDDLDIYDDQEGKNVLQTVETLINRDFTYMDQLKLNKRIIATGESIFFVDSPDDGEMGFRNLSRNMQLHGKIALLTVNDIPHEAELDRVRRLNNTHEEPESDQPIIIDRFGLMFHLDNARLIDGYGNKHVFSRDANVLLPINYSALHLKRFVK